MNVVVTTQFGRTYLISAAAYSAIEVARNALEVDDAFEEFAPQILHRNRCEVMLAIPLNPDERD